MKLNLLQRFHRTLFGEEVLEDGQTIIVADEFAPGQEAKVKIIDPETGEEVLADIPVGEHKTEDGDVIVVQQEGVITEVKEADEQEVIIGDVAVGEFKEEEEVAIEAEEDEIDYALQIAALMDRVAKLEDLLMKSVEALESHKKEITKQKEEFATFKKGPAGKLITEQLKLEVQEEKPLTRAELRLMQLKSLTKK